MAKGEDDLKDRVLDAGDELVMCCKALESVISLLGYSIDPPNTENLCHLLRCIGERMEKTTILLRVT